MSQLFSKKNKEVFFAPLGVDNPVTVQVLGICSALGGNSQIGAGYRYGLIRDSNYSVCQCCYFVAEKDNP